MDYWKNYWTKILSGLKIKQYEEKGLKIHKMDVYTGYFQSLFHSKVNGCYGTWDQSKRCGQLEVKKKFNYNFIAKESYKCLIGFWPLLDTLL